MPLTLDGTTGVSAVQAGAVESGDLPAEAYQKNNILGTVSESGGVPTGAMIERGSNANGEFVKYADGTVICTKRDFSATTDLVTPSGIGSCSTGALANWTYPVAFVLEPTVSAGLRSSGDAANRDADCAVVFTDNDNAKISVRDMDGSTGATLSFHVSAIGRWY